MTSHNNRRTGNTWAGEEDTGETTGVNNQTNQEGPTQAGNVIALLLLLSWAWKHKADPNRQEVAPKVAPPMIIAPNERGQGNVSPSRCCRSVKRCRFTVV